MKNTRDLQFISHKLRTFFIAKNFREVSAESSPTCVSSTFHETDDLFECEQEGNCDDLKILVTELLPFFGFEIPLIVPYESVYKKYKVPFLGELELQKLSDDFCSAVLLEMVPAQVETLHCIVQGVKIMSLTRCSTSSRFTGSVDKEKCAQALSKADLLTTNPVAFYGALKLGSDQLSL